MYPKPEKPEKEQNGAYLLHRKWYGDPKEFGYKDLMLISLGLKPNGAMQDSEVAFLKDLATWTRVMGDGIFATRPWLVYGELEPEQEAGEFELDKKGIVFDDPAVQPPSIPQE